MLRHQAAQSGMTSAARPQPRSASTRNSVVSNHSSAPVGVRLNQRCRLHVGQQRTSPQPERLVEYPRGPLRVAESQRRPARGGKRLEPWKSTSPGATRSR